MSRFLHVASGEPPYISAGSHMLCGRSTITERVDRLYSNAFVNIKSFVQLIVSTYLYLSLLKHLTAQRDPEGGISHKEALLRS